MCVCVFVVVVVVVVVVFFVFLFLFFLSCARIPLSLCTFDITCAQESRDEPTVQCTSSTTLETG